jgi:hypothetical protein
MTRSYSLVFFSFLLCLLWIAPSSFANETIVTFDVSGSFTGVPNPPGTVSFSSNSTVTINTTLGEIVGAYLDIPTLSGAVFTGTPASTTGINGFLWIDKNGDTLGLGLIPLLGSPIGTDDLIDYVGSLAYGSLTSTSPAYAGVNLQGTIDLTPTPENATIVLFATGLFIIAFLRPRRSGRDLTRV